jgi:hypothetical protein
VWKNVRCKYVGFEHYRRILLSNPYQKDADFILGEGDIVRYLECDNYDFITARCVNRYPLMVGENIRHSISESAYYIYLEAIREQMEKVSPDYVDAFDECIRGYSFYPANLFVTKWEHFNAYCEWLFSIILDVIDKENLDKYDDYSKRVVGFFAERLLTVWLLMHNYHIKELFFLSKDV